MKLKLINDKEMISFMTGIHDLYHEMSPNIDDGVTKNEENPTFIRAIDYMNVTYKQNID